MDTTTSANSDLGYLHKKFKKVAAAFTAESSGGQERAAASAECGAPATGDDAKLDGPPATLAAENAAVKASPGAAAKSGGGRYVCPYCQHACAKPSVLEKHIRAHTNERPYPCVPCGFAFKTKSNLYKHCKSRTHVLKVEEGGQPVPMDAAEGGSDDTSENDENAPVDDSDEGEPIVGHQDPTDPPAPHPPTPQIDPPPSSSTPDKFKTPYKPKFHNLKASDEAGEGVAPPASGTPPAECAPAGRPSPGFLQERISQIISQNQAIVETMDPIWPRRYVRQSSRDKEPSCSVAKQLVPQRPEAKKAPGRERSSSLSVEAQDPSPLPLSLKTNPVTPALKFVQETDDSQRKRSYSEGPGDNHLRHSVRNLLHPQNPEGSIIKDILLKSRGLLAPENAEDLPAASSTCSFSVSALLHPDDDADRKRAKLSPPAKSRPPLPLLFGGEVEIRDGHQRTVMRIDPQAPPEARPEVSVLPVPHVPGIPGPYSSGNVVYPVEAPKPASVPLIAVHPPDSADEEPASRFLRPSSLSLQPGTFSVKKTSMTGMDPSSGQPSMLCVSGPGMTLVSPETPRPRKLIRQLYLNGHAYTYLGLKCSTRVYFCCLSKAQPMYVPHQPKLSMYSQWTTRPAPGADSGSPVEAMGAYDSRQRPATASTARSADGGRMILTHSSYWTNRDRPASAHVKIQELDDRSRPANHNQADDNTDIDEKVDKVDKVEKLEKLEKLEKVKATCSSTQPSVAQQPKRVRIFAGGFKSTEEYTYVRGRGRGRYVCEECGIRCKKPSMLKKHIRTHTDLRPYTCRQCNFSFKTKGNLTKHMKSKAHHKKCTELGIVPVPTSVDDANIDEESLARQESLKKMAGSVSGNEGESDVDDEDDDDNEEDDDDEDDDELDDDMADDDGNNAEGDSSAGQFEDAAPRLKELGEREQEVARSLLDLGVMAPAGLAKPTTYPYASRAPDEVPEAPDVKEEAPPTAPVSPVKLNQAVDLSTLGRSASPAQPPVLGSIYSSKVPSDSAEAEAEAQPASGMLQAYLTEKAMKEGQMKRHQVKLTSVVMTTAEHQRPPAVDQQTKRVEFVAPATAAAIASSAVAAAALSGSTPAAAPVTYRLTDDGKTACSICSKVFTKPSQLRLHINIHYFERPFRCEACAVSFRTKGHLQKHKRSVTHFNKVNMNLTFGTPSTENPRPFKCSDCMIAFRIHGHLAKHLRSKMHIMKLECLGKLPFGTYAEMERSGVNLNEIDTTDCHNSLESLQSLAHRLYKQDPAKIQQWQQEVQVAAESRERTVSCSSEEFSDVADEELDEDGDDSDGLPDEALRQQQQQQQQQRKMDAIETPSVQMPPPKVSPLPPEAPKAPLAATLPTTLYCSACGESFASGESFHAHVLDKHRAPVSNSAYIRPDVRSPSPLTPLKSSASSSEFNRQHAMDARRESPTRAAPEASRPVQWNLNPDVGYPPPQMYYPHPSHAWPGRPKFTDYVPLNPMAAVPPPPHWHQDPSAVAWMASRHLMLPLTIGGPLPAPSFPVPGAPMPGYTNNGTLRAGRHLSPVPAAASSVAGPSDEAPCEICGKSFANKDQLRQHVMSHAQLRPFVCEFCDAGFTTQKHLEAHLVLHRPRTS